MDQGESVYLDFVRFVAASLVVLTHLIQFDMLPDALANRAPNLGREAVIVFFVLSGYVIAFATDTKYRTVETYLVSRASRLYSVALPVLLLAFCVDSIGIYLLNGSYTHLYQYEKFYFYIPFHLLFLGEVWTFAERPFTADPYWSLSFEAWYYVWFACLCFFSGWRRILLFVVIAAIVGYQHWILFPIWLSGVWLYRSRNSFKLSTGLARWGMVVSALVVLALEYTGVDTMLWHLGRNTWPFPHLPQGSTDQYLLDYAICICAVCHLLCVKRAKLKFPKRLAHSIRYVASYTFTLYLIHTVVLSSWRNNFAYDKGSYLQFWLLIALIVGATFLLGQITERRRGVFERGIVLTLAKIKQVKSGFGA